MCRGPLCAETNQKHVRTPGPLGIDDADDPNQPDLEVELTGPTPLGTRPKTHGQARLKMVAEASTPKGATAASAANLKKPGPSTIQQLQAEIDAANKKIKPIVDKKGRLDEDDRVLCEKLVNKIVDAYKLGRQFIKAIEVSARTESENHAETSDTFITAFVSILQYPGFVTNVLMHEGAHAQRNAELADAGIKFDALGDMNADIYSALKEFEGAQLEIDHAAVTDITPAEVKVATSLRDGHLKEIGTLMGDKAKEEVAQGNLHQVRGQFIQKLKARRRNKP